MPRIGLDTAKVVAAAADMADLEGIEAVTISSLARVFGVSHAALYNHVGNIEDLRIEIAIFGLRELADDVTNITVGRARREAVFALASAYVAFARRRPGVYSTTLRAANPGHLRHAAAANALLRVVYRTLEGFGIEGDDLVHVVRHCRSLLHGFVSIEAAGGWGMPVDTDESLRRMLDLLVSSLEASATA